jgi:uncharacterized protein
MELFELFIAQPLLMKWTRIAPDLERFRAPHGNVKWALLALAGSWTLAAFGEEMVYRGYLMNRVCGILYSSRTAWAVGLVVVSIAFGAAHLGQGFTGQLENLLDGPLLGGIYLACGRNLTVPIVTHGNHRHP